jgi:hypothetical protein
VRRVAPVKTVGWTGQWNDGTLGWRTSTFLNGGTETMDTAQTDAIKAGGDGRFFRCRITVTPLKDSRGRYITRKGRR